MGESVATHSGEGLSQSADCSPTCPITPPLLELRHVSKRFGAVPACDEVSLSIDPGEIRGLLGQNGAGKSTLMKIVTGLVLPDGGEVFIHGRRVAPGDPVSAVSHGIAMVHQHFSLVRPMTVWQNVTLGERGRIDVRWTVRQVEEIGERYGLRVDPHAKVEDLSPGERQRVEIIKALRRNPDVLILDEPTSVLTQAESRRLFDVLGRLVREHGRAVVLISHRLEEILHATDRVTVLRDGRVVSTVASPETTPACLAREMLGREVSIHRKAAVLGLGDAAAAALPPVDRPGPPARASIPTDPLGPDEEPAPAAGGSVLELSEVRVTAADGRPLLDGLSLHVGRGEILGVAGVEGNGQAALVDLLSNLIRPESGIVRVEGRPVSVGRGEEMLGAGVAVIPADRHDSGCVLDMSVAENLVLGRLETVTRRGVIRRRLMAAQAEELVEQFSIATGGVGAPMRSLSGGNQQRLVLARELSRSPRVLVAGQPTHGLDVGAIEYMWDRVREVAAAGTAVLLVSTELDEILALSHRIAVIHRGRIAGEMCRDEVELERLGLLMGGRAA